MPDEKKEEKFDAENEDAEKVSFSEKGSGKKKHEAKLDEPGDGNPALKTHLQHGDPDKHHDESKTFEGHAKEGETTDIEDADGNKLATIRRHDERHSQKDSSSPPRQKKETRERKAEKPVEEVKNEEESPEEKEEEGREEKKTPARKPPAAPKPSPTTPPAQQQPPVRKPAQRKKPAAGKKDPSAPAEPPEGSAPPPREEGIPPVSTDEPAPPQEEKETPRAPELEEEGEEGSGEEPSEEREEEEEKEEEGSEEEGKGSGEEPAGEPPAKSPAPEGAPQPAPSDPHPRDSSQSEPLHPNRPPHHPITGESVPENSPKKKDSGGEKEEGKEGDSADGKKKESLFKRYRKAGGAKNLAKDATKKAMKNMARGAAVAFFSATWLFWVILFIIIIVVALLHSTCKLDIDLGARWKNVLKSGVCVIYEWTGDLGKAAVKWYVAKEIDWAQSPVSRSDVLKEAQARGTENFDEIYEELLQDKLVDPSLSPAERAAAEERLRRTSENQVPGNMMATMESELILSQLGPEFSVNSLDRTTLGGLKPTTIHGLKSLQKAAGIPLQITGGTEIGYGHSAAHLAGAKVDLRSTAELNDFFEEQLAGVTPVGQTAKGFPIYEEVQIGTAVFRLIDERTNTTGGPHWDLEVVRLATAKDPPE
jgi:hypothetical protein